MSIDRLAQIYKYDVPDSVEPGEYAQLVISVWVEAVRKIVATYVPSDIQINSSGNAYSVQFYFESVGELPEPIFNISVQQYVNGVRLDFNPKRIRDYTWLQDVISDIKDFAQKGGYQAHNTQVDLAIDLINEGVSAATFTINKLGVKRTGLFNATNGDKETEYYGVRGSNAYVRIYNKHSEQIAYLSKKYRKLKASAFKKYYSMRAEINAGNVNSDDVIAVFADYSFDSSPFFDRDFTQKDEFESAITWALGQLREEEERQVPSDWRRMEIVLRTEKLASNKVTFEDSVVYEYIDSITNADLTTISDYTLRALTVGIQNGIIQVNELTQNEKARYRKILKYDHIVVFRTLSGGTQRIMSIDDFNRKIDPTKVTFQKHITKKSNTYLRDKVRETFDLVKDDLKAELISYTI